MAEYKLIGHDYTTPEMLAKVTGQAKFSEDIRAEGMLFCKLLLSPMPHAKVLKIDASEALAMNGVAAILTPDDLPEVTVPPADLTPFALGGWTERALTKEPLYEGEPILAVAAVDEVTAAAAIEKIKVDLEPLPFVIDPLDALRPDGPNGRTQGNVFVGHVGIDSKDIQTLKWTAKDFEEVAAGRLPWDAKASVETSVGDVEAGLKQADLVLDETFFIQSTAHQVLEPRSTFAYWQNGKLYLYGSTQSMIRSVGPIARWVGIEPSQVVFVSEYSGGGFGSKIQSYPYVAIPALLSKKTNRPVMLRISREAENYIGRMRPGFQARITMGFRKDGRITAIDSFIIEDPGPYELTGQAEVAAQVASNSYQPLAIRFRGIYVATNTPPKGAQRAPGLPQSVCMFEPLISKAARKLGLDQVEIRKINAPSSDSKFGVREPLQNMTSAYVREALDRGAERFKWQERKQRVSQHSGPKVRGIGVSVGSFTAGSVGYDGLILVKPDGKLYIHQGIGNFGALAVMDTARVAAEFLGMPWKQCEVVWGGTGKHVPWSSNSGGSQTAHAHSRANYATALDLKRKLQEIAAQQMGGSPEAYEVDNGYVYRKDSTGSSLAFAKAAELAIKLGGKYDGHEIPQQVNAVTKASVEALAGQGLIGVAKDEFPRKGVTQGFNAGFAEVELDLETGVCRIVDYTSVADVGTVLHPRNLGGQILGGSVEGFGHITSRNMIYERQSGRLLSRRMYQIRPPSILDVPLEMTWDAVNIPDPQNPVGVKGTGEPPVGAAAGAVLCAISDALSRVDKDIIYRTPVLVDRVLAALGSGKIQDLLATYA